MADLLVIDGSNLFWRSFHGLKERLLSGGIWTWAVHGTLNTIAKTVRAQPADHVVVAFDIGGSDFRRDLLPTYKAARASGRDYDEAFTQQEAVVSLLGDLGVFVWYEQGVEGDDVIATCVHRWRDALDDVLVVSGDKDFRQLIGPTVRVYRPPLGPAPEEMWDEARVRERYGGLSPRQLVDVWALSGDASDGIPGARGIGEKKALALIQKHGSASAAVLSEKRLDGQEEAVRIAYRLIDLWTPHAKCEFDLVSTRWNPTTPLDDGARDVLQQLDRYALERIAGAWLSGSLWDVSRPRGTRRLRS